MEVGVGLEVIKAAGEMVKEEEETEETAKEEEETEEAAKEEQETEEVAKEEETEGVVCRSKTRDMMQESHIRRAFVPPHN